MKRQNDMKKFIYKPTPPQKKKLLVFYLSRFIYVFLYYFFLTGFHFKTLFI